LPATILRPVFFMQNFRSLWSSPKDGVLAFGLKPVTPLQMIAADDIGAFVTLAFHWPGKFIGTATEIGGDSLTMPQVAETRTRATGEPVRFVEIPLEQIRSLNAEQTHMLAWFNESGSSADIPALRRLYPGLHTFEAWLRG
jgi:uncharacterized protein YbjT (DUF2867 family)